MRSSNYKFDEMFCLEFWNKYAKFRTVESKQNKNKKNFEEYFPSLQTFKVINITLSVQYP